MTLKPKTNFITTFWVSCTLMKKERNELDIRHWITQSISAVHWMCI